MKMNFSLTYEKGIFSNEEMMRIYFFKCGKSRLISGSRQTIVRLTDGTLIGFGCHYIDNRCPDPDTNTLNRIGQIPNIREIVRGCHTIIRLKNRTLMATGVNLFGELGHERNIESDTINEIIGIKNVKKVACGVFHTLIILTDGRLMSCGFNGSGQLGLGDNFNRCRFTEITGLPNAVSEVMCGNQNTIIMLTDGTLMSTGANLNGELGLGNYHNQNTFQEIKGIGKNIIAKIACGRNHTFISLLDGRLMGCGNNFYGQLGLGDRLNRNVFTEIFPRKNIVDVVCGSSHTLVLLTDGKLMSCGANGNGELGLGRVFEAVTVFIEVIGVGRNIAELLCGNHHTIIRLTDGRLMGCGYNNYGQLLFPEYSTHERNYSFTEIKKYSKLKKKCVIS
ncbi:MAG: chromosome condensation regulator [Hyperionvirus sp.]|uniref:Chromosome condensation regulator n=1 Tax=Hyperionvirus sp. TaxID=2487770 RepID=A0A3G5AC23_9VIRU|nr:MAG: chromosome condensation regulator [Hyperionvirus sp.]